MQATPVYLCNFISVNEFSPLSKANSGETHSVRTCQFRFIGLVNPPEKVLLMIVDTVTNTKVLEHKYDKYQRICMR